MAHVTKVHPCPWTLTAHGIRDAEGRAVLSCVPENAADAVLIITAVNQYRAVCAFLQDFRYDMTRPWSAAEVYAWQTRADALHKALVEPLLP